MSAAADRDKRVLFRRLLAENGDKIYSFALGLSGNPTEAEDLVSEAFAKALKNFDRYDPSKGFHSWLFKMVQNMHIDRKRRLETRRTVAIEGLSAKDAKSSFADSLRSAEPEVDHGLSAAESAEAVRKGLLQVPEDFKSPLMMCDMFSMSYEEIASRLGIPVGTVRSRIFRGRKILRGILAPYVREGGSI